MMSTNHNQALEDTPQYMNEQNIAHKNTIPNADSEEFIYQDAKHAFREQKTTL